MAIQEAIARFEAAEKELAAAERALHRLLPREVFALIGGSSRGKLLYAVRTGRLEQAIATVRKGR